MAASEVVDCASVSGADPRSNLLANDQRAEALISSESLFAQPRDIVGWRTADETSVLPAELRRTHVTDAETSSLASTFLTQH